MIKDYFLLSIRNLRKRKVRSWLTMIGIFISIATIFTLVSISLGLQGAIEEQFRTLGADKFFIQPRGQLGAPGSGGAVELTTKDIEVIEKVPGVKKVGYFVVGNAKVSFAGGTRYVNAIGMPPEAIDIFSEISSYKAEEGRLLEDHDEGEVMIGSQYKNNNLFRRPVHVGDKIEVNDREFRVRGILASVGNPGDDRLVYMLRDDFKDLFNSGDRVDQVAVQVDDSNNLKDIAARVEKRLRQFRGVDEESQDFTILTPEELLESFGTVLNIITGFLIAVAAISLLVGAIGITNTIYTSVLERTKEIGVMKAIGAKNSDILLLFLIESSLLGLVGGIIGVILGIGISKGIEFIARTSLGTSLLQAAFPAYLIIGCLIFAAVIGAVAGLVPSWKASKLNPVDALRYE